MGVKEKNDFFRPDVTFGVDARWLLNRFNDGKKISRDRPSGSLLIPFGVRYCPQGLREGAQGWGTDLARAFLRANSVVRRANDFGMPKYRRKTPFFTYPNFNLLCIFKIRRITSLVEPFHFGSCGENSLIFQLRPIFTPKELCSFSY